MKRRNRPWLKRINDIYGVKDPGDLNRDEDGHGTEVTGLIGGKDGIGIAPNANVTVYRVPEATKGLFSRGDGHGGTTKSALKMAIEKACHEGNEIINVSWGNSEDEKGRKRSEQEDPKFFKDLARMGCLVVKSAGNSSVREHFKTDDPDDAYLRVASISALGGYSDFTSIGEINAPGDGVFTLETEDQDYHRHLSKNKKCGTQKGRFISGTSVASPITAAVAAQVSMVLKKRKKFKQLKGPDRIKLLNRILRASNLFNTVNALRAVTIAMSWNEKAISSIPTVEQLRNLISSPLNPLCDKKLGQCSNINQCDKFKACYHEKRKYVTLCPKPDKSNFKDLIESARQAGNDELIGTWLFATPDLMKLAINNAGDNWREVTARVLATIRDTHDEMEKAGDYVMEIIDQTDRFPTIIKEVAKTVFFSHQKPKNSQAIIEKLINLPNLPSVVKELAMDLEWSKEKGNDIIQDFIMKAIPKLKNNQKLISGISQLFQKTGSEFQEAAQIIRELLKKDLNKESASALAISIIESKTINGKDKEKYLTQLMDKIRTDLTMVEDFLDQLKKDLESYWSRHDEDVDDKQIKLLMDLLDKIYSSENITTNILEKTWDVVNASDGNLDRRKIIDVLLKSKNLSKNLLDELLDTATHRDTRENLAKAIVEKVSTPEYLKIVSGLRFTSALEDVMEKLPDSWTAAILENYLRYGEVDAWALNRITEIIFDLQVPQKEKVTLINLTLSNMKKNNVPAKEFMENIEKRLGTWMVEREDSKDAVLMLKAILGDSLSPEDDEALEETLKVLVGSRIPIEGWEGVVRTALAKVQKNKSIQLSLLYLADREWVPRETASNIIETILKKRDLDDWVIEEIVNTLSESEERIPEQQRFVDFVFAQPYLDEGVLEELVNLASSDNMNTSESRELLLKVAKKLNIVPAKYASDVVEEIVDALRSDELKIPQQEEIIDTIMEVAPLNSDVIAELLAYWRPDRKGNFKSSRDFAQRNILKLISMNHANSVAANTVFRILGKLKRPLPSQMTLFNMASKLRRQCSVCDSINMIEATQSPSFTRSEAGNILKRILKSNDLGHYELDEITMAVVESDKDVVDEMGIFHQVAIHPKTSSGTLSDIVNYLDDSSKKKKRSSTRVLDAILKHENAKDFTKERANKIKQDALKKGFLEYLFPF